MYKVVQTIFFLTTACVAAPLASSRNILEERVGGGSPLCPTTGRSTSLVKTGCVYPVAYVGNFTNSVIWDFSKLTSIPDDLAVDEFDVPKEQVRGAVYDQRYTASNVQVANGTLQIKVPGKQKSLPILGGQVETAVQDILYASVRTTAQVSSVPGTCHGMCCLASSLCYLSLTYSQASSSTAATPRRQI